LTPGGHRRDVEPDAHLRLRTRRRHAAEHHSDARKLSPHEVARPSATPIDDGTDSFD
jgi:hypothetical protein